MTAKPSDPDYDNAWTFTSPGVNSVSERGGVIVVDLAEDLHDPFPGTDCTCPTDAVVVQQLVWTVQAALGSTAPVEITVDGARSEFLWLQGRTGADPAVLAPIIIGAPLDGSTVSGELLVSGSEDTPSDNAVYSVDRLDGAGVDRGFTTGTSRAGRGEFAFALELAPGRYRIRVWDTLEDGTGVYAEDTKVITVE